MFLECGDTGYEIGESHYVEMENCNFLYILVNNISITLLILTLFNALNVGNINLAYGHDISNELSEPTVLISLLVRNKAHVLPYTLFYIENLDYPKDRISLW